MSNRTISLNEDLYQYLLDVSLRETPVLKELRQVTATLPHANMQIAPEQGQFMALLAQLINTKKALEIGVFTGYSSLCVAMALPKGGKLIACDIDTQWNQLAQSYWKKAGVMDKIQLRIAPALVTLDQLLQDQQQGSFDFIFIDADKENYLNYYERCLLLLRPGGLICIDNTLWDGAVADPNNNSASTQAIRALNRYLLQDQRIDLSLLPIGDGLTVARKKN